MGALWMLRRPQHALGRPQGGVAGAETTHPSSRVGEGPLRPVAAVQGGR